MTTPTPGTGRAPLRVTPQQVAADPRLREAARTLADLYLTGHSMADWLEGADHTPLGHREFIADLIDADHTLDHHDRWLHRLAGRDLRPLDETEPWLIDRPWRKHPEA